MEEKGVSSIVVIAIVIIIVVVAIGAYIMLSGGEGGVVGSASSIDFKIDITNSVTSMSRYRARNIGADNMDLRADVTAPGITVSTILSVSQREGWIKTDNVWMSFSDLDRDFDMQWFSYYLVLIDYMGRLSDWTGGGHEYSYNGYTYRIYDIQVNPSLLDSVFEPV